jgi:hypothetical protein
MDRLDDRLDAVVGAGRLPINKAERCIAAEWIAVHRWFVESQASM